MYYNNALLSVHSYKVSESRMMQKHFFSFLKAFFFLMTVYLLYEELDIFVAKPTHTSSFKTNIGNKEKAFDFRYFRLFQVLKTIQT